MPESRSAVASNGAERTAEPGSTAAEFLTSALDQKSGDRHQDATVQSAPLSAAESAFSSVQAETASSTEQPPPVSNPTDNVVSLDAARASAGSAQAKAAAFGLKISEIKINEKDGRGKTISEIFFARREYVIYESDKRILIQYADEDDRAGAQIKLVAELIPLRDRLNYMIVGSKLPASYRDQIAEALRLGLEGQQSVARSTLEAAIADARERLLRVGRLSYLAYAAITSIAVSMLLIHAGANWLNGGDAEQLTLLAASSGMIGALFSIAIAIRGRSVEIDSNWAMNAFDGAVRVGIGAISGAILFLILNSGLISDIKAGAMTFVGSGSSWKSAILIGFAAGFLERLVPDMLEKKAGAGSPPPVLPGPKPQ